MSNRPIQFRWSRRYHCISHWNYISELSHLSIFFRACVCVGYTVIPGIQFFASINDMQSMVLANNGVYYGLKVVFACLHISLSPSS